MKLYETLEKTLKKEPNFVTDFGEIKKWVIITKAQNHDVELISLLLEDEELKEKFFIKIKDVFVFNQALFLQFIEQKNYLNDSYTAYKNKVGLTIDGKYLNQRNELVLVWPFKDCVLEGGQSREEEKREEIFFNETLAQDEITQLLEPKILTSAKRFTAEGEKPFDQFCRNEQGKINDNLIIKGNNLLALHSLKKEFTGRVKLIYIDPPYNREADAFYNDKFKNSTWLTFMKNRLEGAFALLNDEGFICIQIDDYQLGYLLPLCDEVFNRENRVNIISVKMSESSGVKMAHVDKKLPKIKEFILVYRKGLKARLNPFKIKKSDQGQKLNEYLEYYRSLITNPTDEVKDWNIVSIVKYLRENNLPNDTESIKKFQIENADNVVYRTNNKSFEKLKIKDRLARVISKRGLEYIWWEGKQMLFLSDYIEEYVCDLWTDISTINLNKEGGVDLENGKKPEKLLKRIIELTTEKMDIVLDYHLGSGTTAAVAHKINRRFIGIEQLDYGENDCTIRLNNVIGGDNSGISADEDVKWQGGGSYIYLELKKYNQTFIEQIEKAKDTDELIVIWQLMKSKSFLNYNVDLKKQDAHIEEFKALIMAEQKQHLVELLDKNQLYVNLSSINDTDFAVTAEEKRVTNDFYQLEK